MKIEKTTLEEILTRVDDQAAVKAPELMTPEELDAEVERLEGMTPEEQMRAIGLYGKDGKANMAHPLAARMLTGKMRSIPVGELITVRGKPDTLTKRWLELNGYTLQGDHYVAPQNGTQAAETPAAESNEV